MEKYSDAHFIIDYPDELEQFLKDAISIVNEKIDYINSLFGVEKSIGQLKVSLFIDRKSFVDYIKTTFNDSNLPDWASGCFYGGGIQILIDINKKSSIEFHKHTLLHEMVHLYFNNTIYNQNKINRILWLDESYAKFLDGQHLNMSDEQIRYILTNLKAISPNFNLGLFDKNNGKVVTKEYNGYDMFYAIGRYIFENGLEKEYLEILKTNPAKIRRMNRTILPKAIKYLESTLELKQSV